MAANLLLPMIWANWPNLRKKKKKKKKVQADENWSSI